jgi:hypothetical protein
MRSLQQYKLTAMSTKSCDDWGKGGSFFRRPTTEREEDKCPSRELSKKMGGIDHGSRQKIEDDQWMKEVESPLQGKLARCGSEGGTRMRPRGVTVPTLHKTQQ